METITESRRPLTSRNTSWAKKLASLLAKYNFSPNFISILSIGFSLVTLLSFYLDSKMNTHHLLFMVLAIVGIQGRLLMNLLDGMVAIEHNKKSILGGLFNEVPDRVTDAVIIFGVGIMCLDKPYGMDLAYVAVILSIVTAYLRTLGASLGCPHYFLGPMAKPHRMALITGGCLVAIFYSSIFYYLLIIMNVGLVLTCYRRLARISRTLKNNSSIPN